MQQEAEVGTENAQCRVGNDNYQAAVERSSSGLILLTCIYPATTTSAALMFEGSFDGVNSTASLPLETSTEIWVPGLSGKLDHCLPTAVIDGCV